MQSYINADRRLHFASQIITKANRCFVEPQEDDSHTNLYFDFLGDRIFGRWLRTDRGSFLFAYYLEEHTYKILSFDYEVISIIPTIGHRCTEIEKEVEKEFNTLGLNAIGFSDDLHYVIDQYGFEDDIHEPIPSHDLDFWRHYRSLAEQACHFLMGYLQCFEEVRIWPHHFDTGVYLKLPTGLGIGFGLAMKDKLSDSPYFYMSGNKEESVFEYKDLPKGKTWEWCLHQEWTGAILPLENIKSSSYSEQIEAIKDFLNGALKWFVER